MEESKRDLSFVIRKLLNGFVNDHKDILCEVEVKYLGERIKLPHSDNNYENYRVTFYFIAHKGGYSSTRAQLMGKAMNEARDLINAFIGIEVDLFPMYVNQCE